jgi:hypothetical protein
MPRNSVSQKPVGLVMLKTSDVLTTVLVTESRPRIQTGESRLMSRDVLVRSSQGRRLQPER